MKRWRVPCCLRTLACAFFLIAIAHPAPLLADESTYVYDDLGRLKQIIDGQGNVVTYTYDAVGNILSIENGPGDCPVGAPSLASTASEGCFQGGSCQVTFEGTSLLGASVTTDNPLATASQCHGDCSHLTCSLDVAPSVPVGSVDITLTTTFGSAHTSVAVASGTLLRNGDNHKGTLAADQADTWTFTANSGDSIVLRVGATGFTPRIDVFAPDGTTLVASGFTNSTFNHEAQVVLQTTQAGTYTVKLSSQFAGGSGKYVLRFARVPGSFKVPAGDEGGPLANGAATPGTISLGDLDMWSFTAAIGDGIELRIGTTGFTPRIDLYGPDGALAGSAATNSSFNHDARLALQAPATGSYTVVLSSLYFDHQAGAVGTYTLHLAHAPGTFVVSNGDEGGPLVNGATTPGTITLGDLDLWSFTASAGDGIVLRMGTVGFTPRIELYGPDGAVVGAVAANSSFNHDARLAVQAPNSGTYTVVVSSVFVDSVAPATGSYTLNLAQAPGTFVVSADDEGGPLVNGAVTPGTITLGDLDLWSFTATTGDNLVLRIGTSGFSPRIDLYGPDGAVVGTIASNTSFNHDARLAVQAPSSGTYTVVVSSAFVDNVAPATGTYSLNLAQVPAAFVVSADDEGGPLVNGAVTPGSITLGDLDLWSFTATTGDNLVLRIGTSGFSPRIDLYGPDGAVVGTIASTTSFNHDARLAVQAPSSGTYTVVVSSAFVDNVAPATGTYSLNLAQVPAAFVVSADDEGGPLVNGAVTPGSITLGDLDLWSFTATTGDNLVLRIGTSGFSPRIDLYGPDGAVVGTIASTTSFNHDARLAVQAPSSGTYTVVVSSAFVDNVAPATGTYSLNLAQVPAAFVVSADDEGGPLVNGALTPGTITLGDLDLWSFAANAGDSIVLRMGTTGFTPRIDLYGPDGAVVGSAASGTSFNHDARLAVQAPSSGTYTVVVSSTFVDNVAGATGTYTLTLAHVPGTFVVSGNDEGGPLVGGTAASGTITLGDLDLWSFAGNAGDSIVLRMAATGVTPRISLYGPDGTLIVTAFTNSTFNHDANLSQQLTAAGSYTVVVDSLFFDNQATAVGAYSLTFVQIPGAFVVPDGDDGGPLASGVAQPGSIARGDLDPWTFTANTGDSISLQATKVSGDASFAPHLDLYAPDGTLLKSAFGTTTATLAQVAAGAGTYTVLVSSHNLPNAGTYQLTLTLVTAAP